MMKRNLYVLGIIGLTWYLLHFFVDPRLIPAPHEALIAFANHWDVILMHIVSSLYRILIAIFVTLIIGVPLGILIATHKRIDALVSPLIYALYPVPKIALLPILMLFFGLGDLSKIILVGLIIIFQILVSTRDGVKAINPSYYTSMKTLGATKWQVYQHMIIPATIPNLLTSLRLSIGTSISVLFFAENFATRYGIGYYIMDNWLKLDYKGMFAGIIAISLMGSLLFGCIDLLEKRLCKWQQR